MVRRVRRSETAGTLESSVGILVNVTRGTTRRVKQSLSNKNQQPKRLFVRLIRITGVVVLVLYLGV